MNYDKDMHCFSNEIIVQILNAFSLTPSLVALFDSADNLRYANKAFLDQFGIDENFCDTWAKMMRHAQKTGKGTYTHTVDFDIWLQQALSRRGKEKFKSFETDMKDGKWLWMTETINDSGWMLCIAPDIGKLYNDSDVYLMRQDRDMALRLVRVDELTGAANRRATWEQLQSSIKIARQGYSNSAFSIAIIDIDYFKKINDQYGHFVGDSVLCDFVAQIHTNLRRGDFFGRIGGEEFMLIMNDVDQSQALMIVNRIQEALRPVCLPTGELLTYHFSAGVAQGKNDCDDKLLYTDADRALYQAKLAGRNCAYGFDSDL